MTHMHTCPLCQLSTEPAGDTRQGTWWQAGFSPQEQVRALPHALLSSLVGGRHRTRRQSPSSLGSSLLGPHGPWRGLGTGAWGGRQHYWEEEDSKSEATVACLVLCCPSASVCRRRVPSERDNRWPTLNSEGQTGPRCPASRWAPGVLSHRSCPCPSSTHSFPSPGFARTDVCTPSWSCPPPPHVPPGPLLPLVFTLLLVLIFLLVLVLLPLIPPRAFRTLADTCCSHYNSLQVNQTF